MSSFHTAGPWPDHDDAREYLKNAGVVMSNFEIVGTIRAIKGTIAEFERRVNWSPFLAAGDSARVFDPPTEGRFLSLEGGLVSLTSLSTGVGADGTGGTVQTQGTYFRLLPVNAPAKGQPYQVVEYLSAEYASECFGTGGPYGRAQNIRIVGPWGFCSAIPWDVSQAVIARALARLLPAAGVVKSVQLNGDVVQFQPAAYAALVQGLDDEFEAAVTTYKREPLYL